MSDWRETLLGEVIELKRGYDLPKKDRTSGNVPLVSSSGVTDHHNAAMKKGPGVVTGRYGTLGQVFYVREDFWPLNTTLYVRDFKGNDPKFISYFLRSLDFQAYSDKAAVPGLNRNHLHQAKVRLPNDVAEQRAIAAALSALDDKIEQNRRTAQALDRLARAIFRAWFVDFEPVKAKAAGASSFRSMPQEVFDALPTRLIDSAIGPVPEGWEVGSLGDIASEIRDGAKPDEIDSATAYIGLEHIPKRCIALSEWEPVSKVTSNKSRFRAGQILFGKLRPYFHKVGVAPIDGVCSTDIVVVEPHSPLYFGMTLGLVSSDTFIAYTNACSTGTKMPRTKWADMKRHWLAIPQDLVADAFNTIMQPVAEKIVVDTHESRKLAELRDYLLPKLLSGTARVCATDSMAKVLMS